MCRNAQITPSATMARIASTNTNWIRPMTRPKANLSTNSATTMRTAHAMTRVPSPDRAVFSMLLRVPCPATRPGTFSGRSYRGSRALGHRGLAADEAQPREPVAPDELVAATAARGGNEDEAADLGSDGGHGKHGRPIPERSPWTGVWNQRPGFRQAVET